MVPVAPSALMEVAPVAGGQTAGKTADKAPQPLIAGGVELLTVTPAGRSSMMEKFVRFVSDGAKMSILSLELPPDAIVVGLKVLVPVAGPPVVFTVTVAVLESTKLVTPTGVVASTSPARMVLGYAPLVDEVTVAVITQVPGVATVPAGIVPFVITTLLASLPVSVGPPHAAEAVGVPTIVKFAGIVSVKETPV